MTTFKGKMRFSCDATEPRGVWMTTEDNAWDRECSRILNNPDKYPGGIIYKVAELWQEWEVTRTDAINRTFDVVARCPSEEAASAVLRLMELR